MQITFYGAAREVTGSMHLIGNGNDHILLDCGLFQGRRKETDEKNRVLPFDARIITNVVLSHAHIDHSGRLPMLVRDDFSGRIFCTAATADACKYLLMDSAKIQASDADYLNYKTVRGLLGKLKSSGKETISPKKIKEIKKILKRSPAHINRDMVNDLIRQHRLEKVDPLYTIEDAENTEAYFEDYPYQHTFTVGKQMTCTFYDAGHILGSAISILTLKAGDRAYRICFTGDFGRFEKPIIKNPTLRFAEEDLDIDLLVTESTYGNRIHEPVADMRNQLRQAITETVDRHGTVLIPAFAFGRTQEILYMLHELYLAGEVPKVPVYVDSPLAGKLTRVFGEHPEVYDRDTHKTFLQDGKNPFAFKQMKFVESVEESMALMRDEKPSIIIASSGMCEAGRVLHHLRYRIHQEKNTILIVGFMAQNTLGRRIVEAGEAYAKAGRQGEPPVMKFLNKEYPLKAHVVKLGGFSAHGDKHELLRLVKSSNLRIKRVAVVHGEEDQALSYAKELGQEGLDTIVPRRGETFYIA